MAHISQQFKQLPMFMSAREIRSQYQGLDADRDEWAEETDDEMFDRKYNEAVDDRWHTANDSRSLKDALVEDGVKNPVSLQVPDLGGSLGQPQVLGGHHRVAVMERHKPDALMPVEHFRGHDEAYRSLGRKY